MDGYTALHESAAWADLSDRGKIRVTGEDRVRFLHNMLSNDVKGLSPGQSNYHFVLNAQGRIQADANLYLFPDHILLDSEPALTSKIIAHLQHYIIADNVQLEDVTERLPTIALEGPKAAEMSRVARPDGAIVTTTSVTGQPGVWFFIDPARKTDLIVNLEDAGAVAASPQDLDLVRVENGIPRYGDDFGDTTLPQETQQSRALNFTKGCYLGQEIVERIRSRGQVNKLLVKLGLDGAEPPPAGSAVRAGEQEIGKLTSPVFSPRLGRSLGLAIIRREFSAPGTALKIAGRPAEVLKLDTPGRHGPGPSE